MSATVLAIAAASAALGLSSRESVVAYRAGGQTLFGVQPTAVGLPDIGESGTVGAGGLAAPLRSYHDSGAYRRDLAEVDGAAQRYVAQRLAAVRNRRRVCTVSYVPIRHTPGHGAVYQRVRRYRVSTEPLTGKPAPVLDIDETSLLEPPTCRRTTSTPRRWRCRPRPVTEQRSEPRSGSTTTQSRAAWRCSSSPAGRRHSRR